MTSSWAIRRAREVTPADVAGLVDVLLDCVAGGASVSFMDPLTPARARAFWEQVARDVHRGARALLIAEDAGGICGTAQLVLDLPENQPHRADVAKMLVHRRARGGGLGAALVRAAEDTARECGRTLLVLDTVTGSTADRLYTRMGWQRVGDIPDYALFPRGGLCSTTVFYRDLSAGGMTRASAPDADRSNGYERVASDFIRSRRSIGADVVREWASALPHGAAVLDVGCGHGVPITETLIACGCDVSAIEPSPTLAAAFRAGFPQVELELGPVESSRLFDRAFDGIVAWGVMFLLSPDAQARLIYQAGAALVAGGQLLFTSPRQACTWSDNLTDRPLISLGAHSYSQILAKAGLSLDREFDDDGANHYYVATKR